MKSSLYYNLIGQILKITLYDWLLWDLAVVVKLLPERPLRGVRFEPVVK